MYQPDDTILIRSTSHLRQRHSVANANRKLGAVAQILQIHARLDALGPRLLVDRLALEHVERRLQVLQVADTVGALNVDVVAKEGQQRGKVGVRTLGKDEGEKHGANIGE